jgi:hypothetical protein
MFRRRAKAPATEPTEPAEKGGETAGTAATSGPAAPAVSEATATTSDAAPAKPARPNGPWDVDELDDRPAHVAPRLDLGGVRVRPPAGFKVQIQVDQATQKSTSVMLVGDQGALQLVVVAGAKSKPQWPVTMRALQSDADRRGGTVAEGDGPWGPVLRITIPVTLPDGKQGVQPSVALGIDGPRWMLRATILGKAALDQEQMNKMMAIVQDTVVVRGEEPMAPGEVVALVPPPRPESAAGAPDAGAPDAGAPDAGAADAAQDQGPSEPA